MTGEEGSKRKDRKKDISFVVQSQNVFLMCRGEESFGPQSIAKEKIKEKKK